MIHLEKKSVNIKKFRSGKGIEDCTEIESFLESAIQTLIPADQVVSVKASIYPNWRDEEGFDAASEIHITIQRKETDREQLERLKDELADAKAKVEALEFKAEAEQADREAK